MELEQNQIGNGRERQEWLNNIGSSIGMPPLSLDAIKRHAEQLIENPKIRQHAEVLSDILEWLQPIDFETEAQLQPDQNLTQRHFRVVTVRILIEQAMECDYGLARRQDFIYAYNGSYWKLLDKNDLEHFLGEAAMKVGVDRNVADDFKFRNDLYKQFLRAGYIPAPEVGGESISINLWNRTFEIYQSNQWLREFPREDFLTYQLTFDYDQTAASPKWIEFLNEVLPDVAR